MGSGAAVRVLLADDEPQVRACLVAILKARGFQVQEACDGLEAMNCLEACAGSVDLLITDIKMPRMDGIALARQASERYRGIPVLFISGLVSDPLDSLECKKNTGCAFLRKPFRPSEFMDAIGKLLVRSGDVSLAGSESD